MTARRVTMNRGLCAFILAPRVRLRRAAAVSGLYSCVIDLYILPGAEPARRPQTMGPCPLPLHGSGTARNTVCAIPGHPSTRGAARHRPARQPASTPAGSRGQSPAHRTSTLRNHFSCGLARCGAVGATSHGARSLQPTTCSLRAARTGASGYRRMSRCLIRATHRRWGPVSKHLTRPPPVCDHLH